MQNSINKPVFVVGSPRSGTSILTWCLGQHPNMIPLPESGWMGQFAINVAISYNIGSARPNRSVLSAMGIARDEFFANFGRAINDLVLSHREDLEKNRKMRRTEPGSKTRWVDGTPEYSFYICGLRKLFPSAKFIHIVRDATSVVRSMLNFHRLGAGKLVASEQEAYTYWWRTVNSCLLAERAYGPDVVFRLRHSDLVNTPENALQASLNFLGESFVAKCLDPLQTRINSSEVPADFKIGDSNTDPGLVEQATQLSREIEESTPPANASATALNEIELAFNERVQYIATVDNQYQKALEVIRTLQATKPQK
jgi:sulfotransferase family protein